MDALFYQDHHYFTQQFPGQVGGECIEDTSPGGGDLSGGGPGSYWCEAELQYFENQECPQPVVRVVRKRNTANRKERRRTQSINNAFADLREAIPNVPKDTKLSKIKTLRLAKSYICYLMGVLKNEDFGEGFKADLANLPRRSSTNIYAYNNQQMNTADGDEGRKLKGRTGWPQHVWALELKQESL